MPVYMEISRLYRTVTIVARGEISPEEIRTAARELSDANVRSFAKVVEVTGATTAWTPDQVGQVAALICGMCRRVGGWVRRPRRASGWARDPAPIMFTSPGPRTAPRRESTTANRGH